MFENPRRSRQARNFTTNVPKILDLKSSSEQIFFRKLSLGAPDPIKKNEFKLSLNALFTCKSQFKQTILIDENDMKLLFCVSM